MRVSALESDEAEAWFMNRLTKLSLTMGALAIVGVINNLSTIRDLASGRSILASVSGRGGRREADWSPVGAPSAKVKAQVFAQFDNECQSETLRILRDLSEKDPKRLRVEFINTSTDEGREASQSAGVTCMMGVLINGHNTYKIQNEKGSRTVQLDGPAGVGRYSSDDLQAAVSQELKAAYGVGLTQTVWTGRPTKAAILGRRESAEIITQFRPAEEAALAFYRKQNGWDPEVIAGPTVVGDHIELVMMKGMTRLARYQYWEGHIVAVQSPGGTWKPVAAKTMGRW